MKENGDLPEKQEVMPVERDAISNEEITSALAKRCSDSRSVSPLSDELPDVVDGGSDLEDEPVDEEQKKTLRLSRMITKQYNSSKCVII